MGKKLDALLGRNFKAAKFKPTINLAIHRLAVLRNHRQARFKQARSDVVQLLQLGHHQRALLRAEHVIKDQNMLDVYDMIEGYCNLLTERVHLIEQERECPEELKEAASGLIYAVSRCGDFPEIQEIRAVLTSRFGKEFAARAVELRNNCGVHLQLIQKLSTRMPSLESRMKALKEIASENNIVLQLEEASSVSVEEQLNEKRKNQHEPEIREEGKNHHIFPKSGKDEELPDSLKNNKKYKDVADAAQAAFESAAYAAAAARAAMELSRSEPQDHDPDSPGTGPRKPFDGHDSVKVKSQVERKEILSENKVENFKMVAEELEKAENILSSDSANEILRGANISVDVEADFFEKELVFDESDNETDDKQINTQSSNQIPSGYHAGEEVGSKMQSAPHLDLEKRPFSVRNRRIQGY